MQKMKLAGFAGLVALIGMLVGCTPVTSAASTDGTVEAPTAAALSATWQKTDTYPLYDSSYSSIIGIQAVTTQCLLSGATFVKVAVTVKTVTSSGAVTTTYYGDKGTYTLSGETITMTATDSNSSSTAFTVSNTTWTTIATPVVSIATCVLADGYMYGLDTSIYKAQGTPSGIIGTQISEYYNSSYSAGYQYTKNESIISASSIIFNSYNSATSTYSTTPTPPSPITYSYVNNGNGTLTLDGTQTATYAIKGSYLLFGSSATDTTFGGWVKQ